MTEEEKKAIEILKEHYIEHNYYDDETISIATKTILNLIQKQQEEIEKIKSLLETNDILLENEAKLSEELKKEIEKKDIDIIEAKEANRQLSIELQKKDKQIDLMANHIATSDSNLCQYLDITTKCKYYAGENGKLCDECIKQYFEKKAEEEK